MRARWWCPQLGVFTQPDDFRYQDPTTTLWGWGNQNPVRYADKTGHCPICVLAAAALLLSFGSTLESDDATRQAAANPALANDPIAGVAASASMLGGLTAIPAAFAGGGALIGEGAVCAISNSPFAQAETQGLQALFGKGPGGAQALLDAASSGSVALPEGITANTLETYLKLADATVASGTDTVGTQALRAAAIRAILAQQ